MPAHISRHSIIGVTSAREGSEPVPQGTTAALPRGQAPGVRLRVMVVDDSPALLDLAAELVDASPWAEVVAKASSGIEALKQAEQCRPDVVLMDLAMPLMNGLEATRVLRTQADAPRVVLMSVHEEEEYHCAAAKAGASAFLPKTDLTRRLPVLLRQLATVADTLS